MTNLPEFVCIGSPKCGSTWLQFLLQSHPQIYIPRERNEIHFFDLYFQNGVAWYEQFFQNCPKDRISGEVTPHYLYLTDPSIIKTVPSIKKFIIIYRDPVARTVSHYKFRMRIDNYRKPFSQFLIDYPEAIEWGLYAKYLKAYYNHYNKNQFLLLEYETATKNIEDTKYILSDFLGIDYELFPKLAGYEVVNRGYIPRNNKIYKIAIDISRKLLDFGLYNARNYLKSIMFVEKFLHKTKQEFEIEVPNDELEKLRSKFLQDQEELNMLIKETSSYMAYSLTKSSTDTRGTKPTFNPHGNCDLATKDS